MKTERPLVCNMNVFTPAQRESHIRITSELFVFAQGVREVENGYEFIFPNEAKMITGIAEFISNERLCCPFLDFSLHVFPVSQPISLCLTGPGGTQEFLRAELAGAIP